MSTSRERNAAGPSERPAYTVSELNRAAKQLLEGEFPELQLTGEVSGFRAYPSGHWYFSLKDAGAAVQAVMFRGSNRSVRIKMQDGLEVLVRGRVSLYEQRGTFQVICEQLELAGAGALHAAFERLKARLAAEGLFDQELKRELPLLPRRIGIATSPTGAALQDILKVLDTRGARIHVVISPCRVQGEGAAEEIVHALDLLDARGDLDAVIVGRGGGSLEDLWAFNEEIVARRVRAMSMPVISAVGHEIDTSICDLAADVRAATPSQAAELVSESVAALDDHVRTLVSRLRTSGRAVLGEARARLARVEPRRLGQRLLQRIQGQGQHCDHLAARLVRDAAHGTRRRRLILDALLGRLAPQALAARVKARGQALQLRLERLHAAVRRRTETARERVRLLDRALYALSPQAVLDRGYSVLTTGAGRVVRAASEVEIGQDLNARLKDGALGLRVQRIQAEGNS